MRDGTYEVWLVDTAEIGGQEYACVYVERTSQDGLEEKYTHVLFEADWGTAEQAKRIAELHNRELPALLEARRWERQEGQCSGPGYSHSPHGGCSGYSTDRT